MNVIRLYEKVADGASFRLTVEAMHKFKVGDVLTDEKNFDYLILSFVEPAGAEQAKANARVTVIGQQLD